MVGFYLTYTVKVGLDAHDIIIVIKLCIRTSKVAQLHVIAESSLHLRLAHGERKADGAPLVGLDGTLHTDVDTCCCFRYDG